MNQLFIANKFFNGKSIDVARRFFDRIKDEAFHSYDAIIQAGEEILPELDPEEYLIAYSFEEFCGRLEKYFKVKRLEKELADAITDLNKPVRYMGE